MFDISFFELLIVAIVGLVVIGPERLPETVRSISLWIGRLKRSLRETRSELEKQLGADDIRRQLHNEEVMQSLERTRREIESAMQDNPIATAKAQEQSVYAEEEVLPDHAHTNEAPVAASEKTATLPSAPGADEAAGKHEIYTTSDDRTPAHIESIDNDSPKKVSPP